MSHADDDTTIEEHDLGLAHDLPKLISRRRAMTLLAGSLGSVALAACGSSSGDAAGTTARATTSAASDGTTSADTTGTIAEETAGPFPGDGSNGPNVLADSGGGKPLAGTAVYVWHCDREGRYSMYSDGVTNENYLRGVQAADANGALSFTSIFPACYQGRWPHVHFEIYPTVTDATAAGSPSATSQLALPADVCAAVNASAEYASSQASFSQVSLASDMVFSDGYDSQLPTVTGSVADGYVAALAVVV
jgi:hypothetical protein